MCFPDPQIYLQFTHIICFVFVFPCVCIDHDLPFHYDISLFISACESLNVHLSICGHTHLFLRQTSNSCHNLHSRFKHVWKGLFLLNLLRDKGIYLSIDHYSVYTHTIVKNTPGETILTGTGAVTIMECCSIAVETVLSSGLRLSL